jgi:hypothetical protein
MPVQNARIAFLWGNEEGIKILWVQCHYIAYSKYCEPIDLSWLYA